MSSRATAPPDLKPVAAPGLLSVRATRLLRTGAVCATSAIALAACLLAAPASATSTTTDPPNTRAANYCVGGTPAKRAKLNAAFAAAVAQDRRKSTLRIALHDGPSGITCGHNANSQIYTRSAIKVALSGAVLRMREKQNRKVSRKEYALMNAAITKSVNSAGQALYNRLGYDGPLRSFFESFGVRGIKYSGNGLWGNTRLSPNNWLGLLQGLTDGTNRGLSVKHKNYLIDRMRHVVNKQRWGVGIGVGRGEVVALKGGWGPSSKQPGYIVNSLGVVRQKSGQYELAILTNRNKSENAGKNRLNAVARIINRAL